jgi:NADPH:quinone reductase-like Zn-dependent oxidoreductase
MTESTARAVIVQPGGGFDKVTFGERPVPEAGPGEITVRLRASSLNYHDYAVVSGMWGPSEPRIPMSDCAGEVEAFAVGDRVVSTFFPTWLEGTPQVEGFDTVPGDGVDGYARERVTAPATAFTHAPRGWDHTEAATLTTAALTAWRALHVDAGLKSGDVVLVQGTGGTSLFGLQFAKAAGAMVIATSSSDAKLERLRELGADHVINYRADPAWGETARRLTDGRGVDHVLDVGGPATLEQSMVAVRVAGHISVIGILSGMAAELPLVPALLRQIRLQGVLVGSRRHQIEMVRGIEACRLRPVVDSRYPLDHLVEAFRHQESNRHFGKICIEI